MLKSLKRSLIRKLGYQKIESWHKYAHAFEAQKQLLSDCDVKTIFDVGANVGQTAEAYRSHFPKAVIHSFEPFSDSFEKLCKRHQGDRQVKSHQVALSCRSGLSKFHVNRGSATNSLLPADEAGPGWCPPGLMDPIATIEVLTQTIGEFCLEHKIEGIDILKMDTQGGERMILEGAASLLEKKAIKLIYSEVLFVPLYEQQAYFHDLCVFLNSYQYRLFDLFSCRYAENGQLKWADAIFLPQN